MDHPDAIEKRIFSCTNCGYKVEVYGEQYFDWGCRNYMITFNCLECRILFESVVSKMECWEPPIVIYDLADEIVCLNCGSDKVKVWNNDSGKCPKCNNEMKYIVEGKIKVNYKSGE